MKLFLFDIDGTLMRGAGAQHAVALIDAIRHVLGIDAAIDGIPVHGMLDRDVVSDMLLRCNQSREEIGQAMPQIVQHAQDIYSDTCPNLEEKVLPGIRETLAEIERRGYPMGLVTGNLTRIGWTKVERAGLRHFFRCGAFADMGASRAELGHIARELSGCDPATRVTSIGDAPSDVEAAKANGFRSVAVATGLTSRETLAALGPDLLLNDLSRQEDRELLIQG